MSIHKHARRWVPIIFLPVAGALIFYLAESGTFGTYLTNPQSLQDLILSFGFWAPLLLILLQALQTTISIFPSQVTTIVAGFVFGPILGLAYSLIGSFLGSAFVFQLSRKYGDELALKFFDKKEIVHFHNFFKQRKLWALFLVRVTPVFPNDLVSFAAGLTKMSFRNFNLVSTTGFVAQMILLTYFGSELSSGVMSLPLIVITVVMSLLLLVVLFRKKLKKILIKDFHKVEKEFANGLKLFM